MMVWGGERLFVFETWSWYIVVASLELTIIAQADYTSASSAACCLGLLSVLGTLLHLTDMHWDPATARGLLSLKPFLCSSLCSLEDLRSSLFSWSLTFCEDATVEWADSVCHSFKDICVVHSFCRVNPGPNSWDLTAGSFVCWVFFFKDRLSLCSLVWLWLSWSSM